jgi:hypothetical protein
MGTIYFDEDKDAHAHPISNCIATVDTDMWDIYCDKNCSVYRDIINGEFVQLRTPEQIKIEEANARKRNEREEAFDDIEWRIQRFNDQEKIGQTPTDDGIKLAKYRQYLRDFTLLDDWWDLPIPNYAQFLRENP